MNRLSRQSRETPGVQLAIFDILKDIYEAKNSKLNTGLLFLDVRKAFDSLDHNQSPLFFGFDFVIADRNKMTK